MIPDVTPNGVFYLPPTGWLTSFYNPPSLLVFKNEDHETTRNFVNAWLTFATHHHLDFVIEGIADRQLAETFAGNPTILQQGFYWSKGSAEI